MKNTGSQILWFICLVLAQVVLFNHVSLAYIINPYIYIYLLLVTPNRQNRTLSIITAFLLGLSVDALSNTWGVHTVATTFIGFIQPFVLKLVAQPEQLDRDRPSLAFMKADFVKYIAILILMHHLLLFLLEAFDFSLILWVLLKTAASSLLTFLCVCILESVRKTK